ncbi:MAG: thioredoxin domain-containing protein [Candidatus Hydrogenedentes bacterium]|nr:thioredoxin domain-containing protein [Candidatus Hydrogenedentota bacterium]
MIAAIRLCGLRAAVFVSVVLAVSCSDPGRSTTADAQSAGPLSTAREADTVSHTETEPTHTNRLANETSPYLLQHAHNPVDWYPWGEEAFQKARDEDKPIFLSVGYSSCHWCHVMERESFENEEIAAMLNEHYVSIKVDREERPDVDEIYMSAVQRMTGSGGWPMSVFLTPELKPFYGGTYFPPEDAYGRPGFKTLLVRLAEMWTLERDKINVSADGLTNDLKGILTGLAEGAKALTTGILSDAVADLGATFDAKDGGFGGAPKFPPSSSIALFLREYQRTGEERTLRMATLTLDKMAQGGMYDHLGGGFARYSTDTQWLVPHFEKMLYDNAQLAQVYLEAYQVTKNPLYRRVVEETFEYILRDMRDERGGFFSAEDADSEGEEGKFYVWTRDEIAEHLGEEDGKIFAAYYNVQERGNFQSREEYHENQNILHTPRSEEAVATGLKMTVEALREKMAQLKRTMLEVRSRRVRPGLDDKVLTSWNALMISAFAQGYRILGDERYRDAAVEASTFIVTDMKRDGKLLRTHRKGESRLPAYLDDYAYMIVALTEVYEATFDTAWLHEADALAKTMIEEFWDADDPGFYFTSGDHKNLLVRTKTSQDSAVPSGNSMAAYGLLRLAKFIDNADYYEKGRRVLEQNHRYLSEYPRAVPKMLAAADFLLYPPKEIALVGAGGSDDVQALLDAVYGAFVPNKIVAFLDPASESAAAVEKDLPLLANKTLIQGKASAYVCKDFACKLPVTSPEELLQQLGVS